ncbi:hypothetical protein [Streptomyces palmae]|uniref:hypothetical protein n=1 Tax=Streptomyces palmae TaxID=1701085 RepID=UPI001432FFC7|nr:hypothetical protein [Streptomyces palmae]
MGTSSEDTPLTPEPEERLGPGEHPEPEEHREPGERPADQDREPGERPEPEEHREPGGHPEPGERPEPDEGQGPDTPGEHDRAPARRGRPLVIASVAAAVLLAGGGGAVWAARADGETSRGGAPAGDGPQAPSTAPGHPVQPGSGLGEPVDGYTIAGKTLTLHFYGGVCTAYTATAKESDDRVTVRVSGHWNQPGQDCVAMARLYQRKITLDSPLGDREVVDAVRGAQVPRGAVGP